MNDVDIRPESNKELAMRFMTGVKNKDRVFHTDLNGFQVWAWHSYYELPRGIHMRIHQHREQRAVEGG